MPSLHQKKFFIVGIDPGLNTAVVLLSLDKRLEHYKVERNMGEKAVISFISSKGNASLISCDVFPPPKFVVKVSSLMNVPLFYPKKSLKKEQKESIAKDLKNPHIRDAYAAAIKAYNSFENVFRKIDKKYKDNANFYKHSYLIGKRLHDLSRVRRGKKLSK